MTTNDRYAPPPISLPALFLKFLRFGCLAFGGPVAQIAMLRQALVEEQRWIEPARFNRLLAVLQVLPGPEAHELCVHLGMVARGRAGGILAGLGFMLPGFVLMLAAAWAYVHFAAGSSTLAAALIGVQCAVLAVILRAVVRIGGHIIEDRLLGVIAIAAFGATLAGAPFWLALVFGGLGYALSTRRALTILVLLIFIAAAATLALLPSAPPVATGAAGASLVPALFVAGLKGGLLTFGGAYTAIPYVRADTVGRGWIGDGAFLDGVAVAGVLPAPLVIFATFAGYVAGGVWGAVAITAGMFLPAFAFSLLLFERLEALVADPALHRLLSGVAAAVVGIIAATFADLALATGWRLERPFAGAMIFAVVVVAAWRLRQPWALPAILMAGGFAGWAIGL